MFTHLKKQNPTQYRFKFQDRCSRKLYNTNYNIKRQLSQSLKEASLNKTKSSQNNFVLIFLPKKPIGLKPNKQTFGVKQITKKINQYQKLLQKIQDLKQCDPKNSNQQNCQNIINEKQIIKNGEELGVSNYYEQYFCRSRASYSSNQRIRSINIRK